MREYLKRERKLLRQYGGERAYLGCVEQAQQLMFMRASADVNVCKAHFLVRKDIRSTHYVNIHPLGPWRVAPWYTSEQDRYTDFISNCNLALHRGKPFALVNATLHIWDGRVACVTQVYEGKYQRIVFIPAGEKNVVTWCEYA